ncbi:hypothetical protein, partial [Leucobacter sp. M11]|uniref:hypothetical protein n=1 Tax=Leucobacter sp. M11 TaxID=2993565 RepID=UPI002D7E39F7
MNRPARSLIPGALAITLAALLTGCVAPDSPPERRINYGFEDVVVPEADWAAESARLARVGATSASLSVGRLDWSAFPRPEAPEAESALVAETGEDFVARAVEGLRTDPSGAPREITLTIDALIPGWIARDESVAGEGADGHRSESFASAAAWESGPVGERLLDVVALVAERYAPDRIALTEFMFDGATFGAADLTSFAAFSGQHDWPRDRDGDIREDDPELGQWRSSVLAGVAADARRIAGEHGARLEIDVRAPEGDLSGDRPESGHDYDRLLAAADELVVWDYFALSGAGPERSRGLAEALRARDPDRISQSIGLWGSDDTVSPAELGDAL